MGIKLENEKNHKYFVDTVYNILSSLKSKYSYDEVEQMSIKEGYLLYFKNKKITGRWHLGIWAVGEWDIKSEYDGHVYKSGYGIETYKPLTICVFLIHDWTFDKFRPSYADWEILIKYGESCDNVIKQLKDIFGNKLKSYYNIVDEDSYNFQHVSKNKYVAYLKGWYYNVFAATLKAKKRRINGYIVSKIILFLAALDKRVAYKKHKFHKDEWNAEFEVAIVFKHGDTAQDDWKTWNDYNKLYKFLRKHLTWNIGIDFTYFDEEGNMPDNIWRGVYWTEEPEKE